MRYGWIAALLSMILMTCRQDAGEPLFDLVYQPREFQIPAGYGSFTALVFSYDNLPTNFGSQLNISGHDVTEVTQIVPLYARLESLDGLDFGFLTSVSVRVCERGPDPCTDFDEVFYLDDLFRRNLTVLNLDPGLRNMKEILSGDLYKMELVFFSGEVTPYNVDCRFEYGFQAVN